MKKLFLVCIVMLLVGALAVCAGAAEEHPHNGNHCVCGGSAVGNHDHVCADITWQPMPANTTNLSNLASGNYYLTQDMTITATTSKTDLKLTICLNGYDITTEATAVIGTMKAGCELNFCDCSGVQNEDGSWTWGGTVYSNRTKSQSYGGIVNLWANSVANIYGGNFVGATSAVNGGVFNVCNDGYSTAGGASNTDPKLTTSFTLYNGHLYGGNVSSKGAVLNTWHSVTIRFYGGVMEGGTSATSGIIALSDSSTTTIDGTIIKGGSLAAVLVMNGTTYCAQYNTLKEALSKVTADQYLRLTGDINENVTIPAGVTIDLAGNDLSGVTVESGALFMDSTTNNYTGVYAGKLIPAAGTVETSYKVSTDAIRRYLTIQEDGGYSFHRFYMGITKLSIKPANVGVGYKATFVASDYVKEHLSSGNAYGYSMWLEGSAKLRKGLSPDTLVGTKEVTLRINNFLNTTLSAAENSARAEIPIYASVYVRLKDGTVVETEPVSYTFRDMTEKANENYGSFSKSQKRALQSLSNNFSASMISWDVDNFHHTDGSIWTKMDNASFNAMLKKSNVIESGNYVLTEDVTVTSITTNMRVGSGKPVTICLNGHTLSYNLRINTYDTFNICDCHADGQEGSIVSTLEATETTERYGAVMYCYYGSVINLYGGNLKATGKITKAGVVATSHDGGSSSKPSTVFNMYGGSISGGQVTAEGGNITLWNKSTFNMYGGKIYGGKADVEGGNINVTAGCTFNMYGGEICDGMVTDGNGGNIIARGTFNMYGGSISGGQALTTEATTCKGGNIYSTGELNLLGGSITNGTVTGMGGNIYTATKKMTLKDTVVSGGTASQVTTDGAINYQTGLGGDIFTTYDGNELTGKVQIDDLYVGQQSSINAHDLTADSKIHLNMDTLGPVSQQENMAKYFTTDMTDVKLVNHNGYTAMVSSDTDVSNIITSDNQFRVGYSIVSINTTVKGLGMSNWGNPNGRKTDGTYNYPLMATTVAITDKENNTFLMITVDLQNPPHSMQDQYLKRIEEMTGVPAENIIVTATHTHNAPGTGSSSNGDTQDYRIFVFNQLVKGAMEAMADRAPATMKTGSFETSGMNFSRHYYYYKNNDKTTEKLYYGDQYGQAPQNGETVYRVRQGDETMNMVSFERTGKKPILIVNWRAHPHRSGGRTKVTLDADVIGATREYVQSTTDYLFAYYQGASGNMNTTSRISGETYKSGKIKEYGIEMARQIRENGLPNLKPAETGLIETTKIYYDAEVDHSQDDKIEQAKALQEYYYANPDEMNVYENQIAKAAEYGFTSVFHATRLISKYNLGATKQMELNIFSIGDSFAFYTAPAELWDSFGEETEALSPFPMTFTIGYCNGGVAYIPYKLDYYVSYEYFYCLFKQDDVINQMQAYYLDALNKQFGN